jgi:hypothetical protein
MVIGTRKNLTPEEARNLASGILARVRLGGDPAAERTNARKAENVSELLKAFMDDHIRPKRKARTANCNRQPGSSPDWRRLFLWFALWPPSGTYDKSGRQN